MSTKVFCDKCGNAVKSPNHVETSQYWSNGYQMSAQKFDLCSACNIELHSWLNKHVERKIPS